MQNVSRGLGGQGWGWEFPGVRVSLKQYILDLPLPSKDLAQVVCSVSSAEANCQPEAMMPLLSPTAPPTLQLMRRRAVGNSSARTCLCGPGRGEPETVPSTPPSVAQGPGPPTHWPRQSWNPARVSGSRKWVKALPQYAPSNPGHSSEDGHRSSAPSCPTCVAHLQTLSSVPDVSVTVRLKRC